MKSISFEGSFNGSLKAPLYLLVGYHGEPKVNLFHNIRIIQGLYYPKRLKVTYSATIRESFFLLFGFNKGTQKEKG